MIISRKEATTDPPPGIYTDSTSSKIIITPQPTNVYGPSRSIKEGALARIPAESLVQFKNGALRDAPTEAFSPLA